MNLKNKKVLITGATGGIGHSLVEKFKNAEIDIEWQNFTEPDYFGLVHGGETKLTNLSSLDFVQMYGVDCAKEFKDIICK